MTPDLKVFQEGTSQRHTARCECGWQSSAGSLKAARDLAADHRRDGCVLGEEPSPAQLVPVAAAPAAVERVGEWSGEQLEILRQQVCPGATNEELAFFAQVCAHKQLDPFLGEIVGIMRWDGRAKNPDGSRGREVMRIQETVEGLRTIAERSGLYGGFRGPQWTADGHTWLDVWLDQSNPPAAARYWVIRKDWIEPAPGVARWASNVQLDRNGNVIAGPWKDRPDEMLAKCAEVRALKRAFSKEFARAGLEVRDVSDAQIVTIEARQAGLDDDGRHELVAEVTEGRTDSTRDLTDEEMLAVRREVARRQADPQTGEIVEEQQPDAVARTIARAAGDLEQRLERLTPSQIGHIKGFRRAKGLTRPLRTLSPEHRNLIAGELDRCERDGWPTIETEEPPPYDNDDVVSAEVVEPDTFGDFSDEPF